MAKSKVKVTHFLALNVGVLRQQPHCYLGLATNALCGSHPLVTTYYCRLGDFVCFLYVCVCVFVVLLYFVLFAFSVFSLRL